ncbi:conserved hypothetical protein [Hyphomicrobiales bacterium]|jgi:hypothetical protein|nr:conserved hypothetical protein [Hyphomicrobiales bacterium]CAH1702853.1 conserved hypothetical protein [Hyphomicrobiales bacterium]CAI0347040.1 conserved hypothetical protein [Hyphomicrobiales bacterium]
MDGAAFKAALNKLGYTQTSFAREFRVKLRTVQNWARIGPPEHVQAFIGAMLRQHILSPETQTWASDSEALADCSDAMYASVHSLFLKSVRAGWPREVVAATMNLLVERALAKKS